MKAQPRFTASLGDGGARLAFELCAGIHLRWGFAAFPPHQLYAILFIPLG